MNPEIGAPRPPDFKQALKEALYLFLMFVLTFTLGVLLASCSSDPTQVGADHYGDPGEPYCSKSICIREASTLFDAPCACLRVSYVDPHPTITDFALYDKRIWPQPSVPLPPSYLWYFNFGLYRPARVGYLYYVPTWTFQWGWAWQRVERFDPETGSAKRP